MKITIVFKNGFSFTITCKSFTLKKNAFEQLTGYEIKDIKDHKPLYISIEDIVCVYRDMEAEEEDEQSQR